MIAIEKFLSRLGPIYGGGRSRSGKPESKHVQLFVDLEAATGTVKGKRVLEIGSDHDLGFLRECVEHGGAASAVGVNPALADDDRGAIKLVKADGRKMPFADNSFDVIGSVAVFEHVFGLGEVLEECYRVLVPGGYLYTEFGPIWSACWGHHLWFYHGGKVVDWRNHRLPPYAHLLMQPSELREWCEHQFGDAELARKIETFVYESPDQNRLFFSDYMSAFESSRFEVVFACGSPDVPHPPGTPQSDYGETFSRLRSLYPDKGGFGHHLIRTLLQKKVLRGIPGFDG